LNHVIIGHRVTKAEVKLPKNILLRNAAALLLFLIVALIAYRSALTIYFLSEDFSMVEGVKNAGIFGFWSHRGSELFRPLIAVSIFIDYHLWGLNAFGYHLTNVLLHGLNGFLLFVITQQLLTRFGFDELRKAGIGLIAALIFLVMPVHAESVTWISGRTDIVGTVGAFAALCLHLAYVQYKRWWLFVLAVVMFWLAMLAKEAMIGLPAFIFLLEVIYGLFIERYLPLRRLILILAGYTLTVGAYLLLRYIVIGELGSAYANILYKPLNWESAPQIYLQTLARTWLPASYDIAGWFKQDTNRPGMVALVSVFVVSIGALVLALRAARTHRDKRGVGFWLLLMVGYLALMLPVFTILRLPFLTYSSEDGRFIYLPSAVAAIMVAAALGNLFRWRRLFWAGAVFVVVILSTSLS
jgi:protein O-mannosyl-transferase